MCLYGCMERERHSHAREQTQQKQRKETRGVSSENCEDNDQTQAKLQWQKEIMLDGWAGRCREYAKS